MQALMEVLTPRDAEWELARAVDPERLPAHIAIIMDGNGRWARRRHLPRVAGHEAGMQAVRGVVETCARMGIRILTLYAFSTENWKRPRSEVETLWRLLRTYLRRELPELLRHDIRLRTIGRLEGLPPTVREEVLEAVRTSASNHGLIVNVALNYSGRAELVDAVGAMLEEARAAQRLAEMEVSEEAIAAHLYTAGLPDPDLLIRTSGEMRISNFLLWQIAYTELYVTETLWPDFGRAELLRAVLAYQRRDRRFGGLSPAGGPRRLREPVAAKLGAPAL
jgi:undecaprenyl diphosphate synthase